MNHAKNAQAHQIKYVKAWPRTNYTNKYRNLVKVLNKIIFFTFKQRCIIMENLID